MLKVEGLTVRYGAVAAVRGISFDLPQGELLTLVGPNGAGKSSTLLAIAGGLRGATVGGSVSFAGESLLGRSPERVARHGLSLVPEGRRIFGSLSVRENLEVAASMRRDRSAARADIDRLLSRFPALGDASNRSAAFLSGGQQQQLALSRALLTRPRLLLLDEPSLGLAPLVIEEVLAIIAELRNDGISILLLEQNALRAVEIADRALLIRHGQIEALDATADGRRMLAAYFGIDTASIGGGG